MIRIVISILLCCSMAFAGDEMRLPGDVRPSSYDIRLLPNFEDDFKIQGHIEIAIVCVQDTNRVVLNSADIDVDEFSVKIREIGSFKQSLVKGLNRLIQQEMIAIEVGDTLIKGKKYQISMDFTSILNNELRGFYRSTYEEDNITKYLAVTQLEATDARRAFPCFDEPDFKATFTITLGRKATMTSASNMPLNKTVSIIEKPGYEWDHYETSLEMSTYLVAMMISEMVSVKSTPLPNNVEFRIWARPNMINQTEYAGKIGPQVLAYYEKYFDINFPLPKQDMAAIPDFAAGAMENWGLITYREADLLIDPKKSSAAAKQRVATVIAHELAHQWFGDLVTMDWWGSLWLNEGFAIYMQHIGTDAVLSEEFKMDEQFITDVVQNAMSFDGLTRSRPMNINVTTPDEIKQLFDAIAYQKGASVIRMCLNVLGEHTFRSGLHLYLTRNAYGNAIQDDLWNALDYQAEKDGIILPASIKTIMDTWTNKQGYPLIRVERDYKSGGATVHQERFLMDSESNIDSSDEIIYQWWVPLTYTSDFSNPHLSAWLSEQAVNKTLITTGARENEWVIFNVDQVGYYRVAYDEDNYDLIMKQLHENHTVISTKNRAQLIDDSLNIARANKLNYNIALNITHYLISERDYIPWRAAITALSYLDTILYSSPVYDEWQNYLSSLISPLYEQVGFNEESTDDHLLIYTRAIATEWACKLRNSDCIQHVMTYYTKWMADTNNDDFVRGVPLTYKSHDENLFLKHNFDSVMSPNQKRLISCTAIENGGRKEWDFAHKMYLESTVAAEKKDLMSAMSCTRQPDILQSMLEMMIDPNSGIRLQDATELFSNVASNPIGNKIALDFLTSRWNDVAKYFQGYAGFGGGAIPTLFQSICNRINTEEQFQKLKKLYDDHAETFKDSQVALQGIEVAESNIQWHINSYNDVEEWLADNPTPPIPTTPVPNTSTTITTHTPPTTTASANPQLMSIPTTMLLSLLFLQLLFQ